MDVVVDVDFPEGKDGRGLGYCRRTTFSVVLYVVEVVGEGSQGAGAEAEEVVLRFETAGRPETCGGSDDLEKV